MVGLTANLNSISIIIHLAGLPFSQHALILYISSLNLDPLLPIFSPQLSHIRTTGGSLNLSSAIERNLLRHQKIDVSVSLHCLHLSKAFAQLHLSYEGIL
ncbi:uncharacterized protein RAG0_03008 [Rhynchosporium agropyri]|uniref:Uncharacterized protein n=1 Tax=Rhynchosporium agropyri TaxID=914238 RepID=A0A1E1K2W0_9HELO|nr:uncharacterized protein RAG0_03008 [Rhynchosporium agropyri]